MQGQVIPIRSFRVPKPAETQFFQLDDSKNKDFMDKDLARSGLTPDDIEAYTSPLTRKEGALAAYAIPYYGLDGKPLVDRDRYPIMFRTRMLYPEFSREQRYTQPSGESLAKHDLPPFVPYIHPLTLSLPGDELVCAEGEKKTAAILKHLGIPAFGIGGCNLWGDPSRKGGVHPWILSLVRLRNVRSITIVPDGDIRRYDICNAYGTFARTLENEGIAVRILDPHGKIDDLIVAWGGKALENWRGIETIQSKDLVQSPASLIKQYGLAFKTDSKDRPVVHQHTSNIMKLMEEHDAFPRLWRNLDNNRIMVGEEAAEPDLTEMEIANYFQHNLGFDKVTNRTIYSCIQALGKRNARSPFLEYVQSQNWDGQQRLDSWLTRLWGVEDNDFTREVATKWLISACARMDKPGTKIDWMLIVIGPQGVGKTSMPGILFKDSSLTLYGEQNDKDLHMLLHSALCVGFDELDSFGKRESSNLKAMVTRNEDSFRPPYGASVEVFPRRFTLYGCGNRHDFLQHDPSGYRRYAVVEVTKLLDFGGLEHERDQLWAEAWHRYQHESVKYWEVVGASDEALKYVIANPLDDKVEEFLARKQSDKITPGRQIGGKIYFTMTELLLYLGMEKESRNSTAIRDLAAILHAKGIVKPTKSSRHPETGGVGKWYEWTPPAHAHI